MIFLFLIVFARVKKYDSKKPLTSTKEKCNIAFVTVCNRKNEIVNGSLRERFAFLLSGKREEPAWMNTRTIQDPLFSCLHMSARARRWLCRVRGG